ncbi:kinetoplast-associated protein-like protein [Leishmania tarentolae]|uniref:Kinetoplast-associated protein-like protein n=1 Tax=Leishmania tarentolae TaxID=5689 RepID=A0A640KBC9_LEITA|nr:kinetoplast-associated protein-like protein [Leishmania tarentolae]
MTGTEVGEAAAVPPALTVGAIVVYECLLDETAGATSWKVGSILALPASLPSSAGHNTREGGSPPPAEGSVEPRNGPKSLKRTPQKVSHIGGTAQDDEENSVAAVPTPPLMPTSVCHTVLIQPWISLASTAGAHGNAGHTSPSGDTNSRSPSPKQHGVTPAARLAEIDAMQKELEAIERFAWDESDGDVAVSPTPEGNRRGRSAAADLDDNENDRRLAGELSQAYTRVLAFRSQSRGYSSLRNDDLHRGSEEGTTAVVDYDEEEDANPELTKQIEHKLAEFRHRIRNILGDMKKTRQNQRELQETQKKVQVSLEDAKQQLREVQEKVQRIDKRHLHEIQGYRLPSVVVKHVMDAVLCVLGEKTKNWAEVATAMRSPSFISNVVSFHHAQLSPEDVQELKKNFIVNPRFSYADVLKGSHALGQFHEWVIRQLQLIEAENAYEKFMGEKMKSSQALIFAREKMEAEAAELRHLEEELEALMGEQAHQLQERRSGTLSGRPTGGEAMSQRPSSPLTNALTPVAESLEAATTTTLQRSGRQSMHSASGAESPASMSERLHAGEAQAAVAADSAEATANNGAAVELLPMAAMPAQQQQVVGMISPGTRWMCPQPGALHSSYVLRSSILCVVGHQQERTVGKPGVASPGNGTTSPAPDIFELTAAQQLLVEEALHSPARTPPPFPQSSTAAGSARASQDTITTQHTKAFTGKEWETVVKASPDELRQAFVEDVAMICQVPTGAVTDVAWMLEALHVQCMVCHPSLDNSEAVQAVIEKGAYPTVMELYAQRKRIPDSLDDESTCQLQQAVRLASMEEEVRAAQQAEAEARRETQSMRDAFEKEKRALMEQMAVAQTLSPALIHNDGPTNLALQEALEERTAQLRHVQVSLAESCARAQSAEGQLTTVQAQLASAEERATKVEAEAQDARAAAELATVQAEKVLKDLMSQLRAVQAASEEERMRRQKELEESQTAAAARETQLLQQLNRMRQQLADAQEHTKAMEEERARQRCTAQANAKRVTELEQKLEEALSDQAAQEKARQLQESMESVRKQREHLQQHSANASVIPWKHHKRCFECAQVRAAKVDAALVEALRTQLAETEAALNFCQVELEVQKSAEEAVKERRVARRAAVTAIREKIEDLAESFATAAAQRQHQSPQQLAFEKQALIRELIARLEEVKNEKAEIKAAIAQAQCAFARIQQRVLNAQGRAAKLEETRQATSKELQTMTRSVSAEDTGNSSTDAELVDISQRVIAASSALTRASDALATHQQHASAEPKQEEAFIANIFCKADDRRRSSREGSDMAMQLMCEVYEAATDSFLSRHQRTWMNICLGVLLMLTVTTLQYKKYDV